MAAHGHFIAPLPARWLRPVIALLNEADPQKIQCTLTAQKDFAQLGFPNRFAAFDFCLAALRAPNLCGENIPDMRDFFDHTLHETWAFLAPHPLGAETPVYVKIGIDDNHLFLNLFSLHIDRKGTLADAIAHYLKTRK